MRFLIYLSLVLSFIQCRQFSPRPDLSGIPVDFEVYRFEQDWFSMDTTQLPEAIHSLELQYSSFFNLYTQGIIRIGSPQERLFGTRVQAFLADPVQQEAYREVQQRFADFLPYQQAISEAFRYYSYYFPDKNQPDLYTFVGYFNQSMVADEGLLAVALEKYLGSDFGPYLQIGIPSFARSKMAPEYLVSDVVKALGKTEFYYSDSLDHLLSKMIYEGLILHFTAQLIPGISEEVLLQYSAEELEFLKRNEASLWKYIIEQKHLFSFEHKIAMRYLNDGPFTPGINDSPSRIGVYLGYRIVQSFQKTHPELTLAEIMEWTDYQALLNTSEYKP